MAILTIPGNATAVLFIGIAFLLAVALRSVMDAFLIPGWIEESTRERRLQITQEVALTALTARS